MTAEVHAVIRTAAAVVVAVSLVLAATATRRVATAAEAQASAAEAQVCWAEAAAMVQGVTTVATVALAKSENYPARRDAVKVWVDDRLLDAQECAR